MARYTDIDLFLKKNELSSDITILSDVSAIGQSIANLALTKRGERPFSPEIGTDLVETLQVFRPEMELVILKEIVKSQLEVQEPRATINQINIERSGDNYNVTIRFQIITNGLIGSTSFTV